MWIEYTREFHRLGPRNNLNETKEKLVTRFVGGLKDKLKNKSHAPTVFLDQCH